MSLAQGNNTPTRPRIEPGSPDPESDALTTRPVRPDSILKLLRCLLKFDATTKDEPTYHAQTHTPMIVLVEISPFHRFTNRRHDKSVYIWPWTSYLLFIRMFFLGFILCYPFANIPLRILARILGQL